MRSDWLKSAVNQLGIQASSCIMLHLSRAFGCLFLVVWWCISCRTCSRSIFTDLNTSLADSMHLTMICDLCLSQICFHACGQLSESGSGADHKALQPSIDDLGRLTLLSFPFVHFRAPKALVCELTEDQEFLRTPLLRCIWLVGQKH